jgi:hypothetical protein
MSFEVKVDGWQLDGGRSGDGPIVICICQWARGCKVNAIHPAGLTHHMMYIPKMVGF